MLLKLPIALSYEDAGFKHNRWLIHYRWMEHDIIHWSTITKRWNTGPIWLHILHMIHMVWNMKPISVFPYKKPWYCLRWIFFRLLPLPVPSKYWEIIYASNKMWFFLKYTYRLIWHLVMMKSLDGNIFRVTGHLCGEWTPRTRPVTRSFDVFFDLYLNKQLSK